MRRMIGALIAWTSVSGGCASKDTVLPQDGPSMQSIYEAHFAAMATGERPGIGVRPVQDGEADLAGYTRTAYNELEMRFPRLPNPTLVMYVYPHLAGHERVPVPGYATAFPLYERLEYALPGEVPAR